MNTKKDEFAPYAPVSAVIGVLRRYRETGGLPWPLTDETLTHVGVSEGNAPRTLATLKFLGLVDEEGKKTDATEHLGKAKSEEYPEVLSEIIRNAYSYVFQFTDPASADQGDFADAFRHYSPQKQRSRMVSLFLGLCKEAGIIAGEPTMIDKKKKVKWPQTATINVQNATTIRTSQKAFQPNVVYNVSRWVEKLRPVLEKLPDIDNPKWNEIERDRWIRALSILLDLYAAPTEEGKQDEMPF